MQEDFNQTGFSQESPLFTAASQAAQTEDPQQSPQLPWWKRPVVLIGVALAFLVIVVILSIVVAQMNRSTETITPSPSPSATPSVSESSQDNLEQGLAEVELRIERADPSDIDNPFPPVTMELELIPAVDAD